MWARADECGWYGTADEWTNGCTDSLDSVRRDYLTGLVDCWKGATCNSVESCYDSVADGLAPLDIADEWAEACRQKGVECGDASYEIADECDIDRIKKYATEVVSDMMSCYDEPCAAIPACLDAARD